MARKCDTAKYRKRRERERVNHNDRVKREQKREREWYARKRQLDQEAEERRRRSPEYQLHQRLVNILRRRLMADPLYRVLMISQIFGGQGLLLRSTLLPNRQILIEQEDTDGSDTL